MGKNCAPLVADLFLFCYETDFMTSLSGDYQADIIEAFNSTSRYLDDTILISISDTEAPFFDLHLSISHVSNGFVSSKMYDKRDHFDFDIVNLPFLDGAPLWNVYFSTHKIC